MISNEEDLEIHTEQTTQSHLDHSIFHDYWWGTFDNA